MQSAYFANDIDTSRTPSYEFCLLPIGLLELGQYPFPPLRLHWDSILWVDVAQRRGSRNLHGSFKLQVSDLPKYGFPGYKSQLFRTKIQLVREVGVLVLYYSRSILWTVQLKGYLQPD